jgi:hypothetical protein
MNVRLPRLDASANYFDPPEVSASLCTPERRIANRIAHPINPAA